MTSSRSYLIRAIYDWLFDNNMTIFIAVDANHPESEVPTEHVKDGQIVLDVSPEAVRDLDLANDYISFNARFSGKLQRIIVPIMAVLAIYSAENGRGMIFGKEDPLSGETDPGSAPTEAASRVRPSGQPSTAKAKKDSKNVPHLKVLKSDDEK